MASRGIEEAQVHWSRIEHRDPTICRAHESDHLREQIRLGPVRNTDSEQGVSRDRPLLPGAPGRRLALDNHHTLAGKISASIRAGVALVAAAHKHGDADQDSS
jgi:hypothetical protein